MKKSVLLLFFLPIIITTGQEVYCQTNIEHFVFFSRDRELIHDSSFYSNPGISGAQITYAWKRIEPEKEEYDFSEIEEDLAFLYSKGKKLFIQIQDVTFDSIRILTPKYMLYDSIYHGGSAPQYWENEEGKLEKGGWIARRWDPAVENQFRKLLIALAEQFDGRIEGINLSETAIDVTNENGINPTGFTTRNYIREIKNNMLVLRTYFEKSVPILYANFMPGDSKEDLKALYDFASEIGHGMGGPDLLVYRKGQMENSYPLIRSIADRVPIGMAVQYGNYSKVNPQTGQQVTVPEILDFAQNYLKTNYIFWCTQEPYFTNEVLPLLKSFEK